MQHRHPRLDARVALAFAAIYVLWGGTFLAIRLAVLVLPPLFASGVRLARMLVTRVASHAYVNPLIALVLGYFVARESLTPSMLLASALVIASVVLILRSPEDRERGTALTLNPSD